MEEPLLLDETAPLLVAVDPLDGSSNIDANASIGTIFTVLPALQHNGEPSAFLQPGVNQLAGGFFVYGPQTVLVVSVGAGTQIFTLDRSTRHVRADPPEGRDPAARRAEYAINGSNSRHWDEPVRTYVEDCKRGKEGPRGRDFNMRWTGSPVVDIYRILSRGGIYLYPGRQAARVPQRAAAAHLRGKPHRVGRRAGRRRRLDRAASACSRCAPKSLHQRVPLIAGSRSEVEHVVRLHDGHADQRRALAAVQPPRVVAVLIS